MDDFVKGFISDGLNSLDTNVSNVTKILSEDFWGSSNAWFSFAESVNAIIMPIALIIITICFLIEFIKITIEMNILKWEFAFKLICKFIFAKVCMDGAFDLLSAIYATVAEWISSIGVGTANIGSAANSIISTKIDSYNFLEMLGVIISMGIVFVGIWIASIIVQVIAYARKFELIVYISIACLPFSFLPLEDGGTSRLPKKFIFGFTSICMQGLFMIISIKLFQILCMEEIMNTLTENQNLMTIVGQLLLGVMVLVMAVIKSSSWARDIFDAA